MKSTPKVPTKCRECKCTEPVALYPGTMVTKCCLRRREASAHAIGGDGAIIREALKTRPRWCPLYNGALIKA